MDAHLIPYLFILKMCFSFAQFEITSISFEVRYWEAMCSKTYICLNVALIDVHTNIWFLLTARTVWFIDRPKSNAKSVCYWLQKPMPWAFSYLFHTMKVMRVKEDVLLYLQILLWQEHTDQDPWETLCLQVWLSCLDVELSSSAIAYSVRCQAVWTLQELGTSSGVFQSKASRSNLPCRHLQLTCIRPWVSIWPPPTIVLQRHQPGPVRLHHHLWKLVFLLILLDLRTCLLWGVLAAPSPSLWTLGTFQRSTKDHWSIRVAKPDRGRAQRASVPRRIHLCQSNQLFNSTRRLQIQVQFSSWEHCPRVSTISMSAFSSILSKWAYP